MSLRAQLAAVSLALLLVPLAAWQLLGRLEGVVRDGEERAQQAVAAATARSLRSEPSIRSLPAGAVLYARPLTYRLIPDGYGDEWRSGTPYRQVLSGGRVQAEVELAEADRRLAIWIKVNDVTPVWGDAPPPTPVVGDEYQLGGAANAPQVDQVLLDLGAGSARVTFRVWAAGPGPVRGVPVTPASVFPPPVGVWQRREDGPGYQIEMVASGSQRIDSLGVTVLDASAPAPGAPVIRAGTGAPIALLRYDGELSTQLESLLPPGARAWILHADGWVVARASRLDVGDPYTGVSWIWSLIYRWFLASRFAAPEVRDDTTFRLFGEELEAAQRAPGASVWRPAPGRDDVVVSTATVLSPGYFLLVEQPNAALGRLVAEGLGGLVVTTVVVMAAIALLLLGYATWLSLRVRRLARAADAAVTSPDRIASFPRSGARDEIGDLNRSFSALLTELRDHNAYLQTLADKLSHELHTPLAVVRSSLENLRLSPLPNDAEEYASRAEDGVRRLGAILSAMSEASRLERSIEDTDRERFDLVEVLAGCVAGYRIVHGDRRIRWDTEQAVAPMWGAPELIAQMLDKLVDNALDFSEPEAPVSVVLDRRGNDWQLTVRNRGPLLPAGAEVRIFESLVSHRPAKPAHLGLGLYIVRLIARFHEGDATARNAASGEGVEIQVRLAADPG